ncbi:putative mitochondrial DNA ligase k alpha [Leptomonas pyrrhocoris]|uniref:Putative mitochondrial DNA ligase k alpha n=1 Tax=Leptomonas pyrrhocoris TaxID=157538 RepID=A0A0N0E0V5_LEPPY|nr:putative mitochondrial DNA ligase k alpha [Leptomonas pyrrhocoris]XP_015665332.1 putative mitochondrial DNA ligase k alpha [Leptomonas pyrrhocoris]KPA86892.1 putative mitochondrial DNA ligase k alpha [Leptomonas pyrrhocoris]KPA86893.1 putative mitochondrial DNA ligase k alpha [Leptomonas pyrrhocoris]|eukprot:XP_015665331.1 putative mitochondrial DNA ligase k alpha [Leptomonas pyrrhocoris]
MKVTWLLRRCGGAVGGRTLILMRAAQRARVGASSWTSLVAASALKRKSPRRQRRSSQDGNHNHRAVVRSTTTATSHLSLAEFHPAIARTWIAAASSKMLQPQHVSPGSRKLAWWICPSCQHQYNRRIDLHLAAGGECPKCKAKPSLQPTATAASPQRGLQRRRGRVGTAAVERKKTATPPSPSAAAVAVIAHRCRPDSSQATLAADNANMLSKSVADDQYLRVRETRNLLPMLAKNFDDEKAKIGAAEVLRVSPKLDGIRCVVAYRADTKQVLFFSRSGTLFECCDDVIDPAVRHLFEVDPTLVLDGELYNDSINLAQLALLQKGKQRPKASRSPSDPAAAFYATLLAAAAGGKEGRTSGAAKGTNKAGGNGGAAVTDTEKPVVIRFEQLTSAIRTTRQHRTPAVAALQRQLQYHVFDVLYARDFVTGSAATVPFSMRHAVLEKLLAEATTYNLSHIQDYNPLVLRCVPNYACTLDSVDTVLRAAMRVGYEGVMIRREGKGKHASVPQAAKTKVRRAAAATSSSATTSTAPAPSSGDGSGGYGYGQRSGTLLKYKVMQDAEYVIVGAVEGSGKWKGSLGSFICVTPDEQQRFTVTPASTDSEKKRMWRTWRQAYKGKALTVQYQELTPDGVPRFPVGKGVRGAADGHDWL